VCFKLSKCHHYSLYSEAEYSIHFLLHSHQNAFHRSHDSEGKNLHDKLCTLCVVIPRGNSWSSTRLQKKQMSAVPIPKLRTVLLWATVTCYQRLGDLHNTNLFLIVLGASKSKSRQVRFSLQMAIFLYP
jgi:hypothetical protein